MADTAAPRATKSWLDRDRFVRAADFLAIAMAVSLPWSSSLSSVLLVLWLVALVPTLDLASVRRAIAAPAGGLAGMLIAVMLIGTLWSEATPSEHFAALKSFIKLLSIPLLLIQFSRSDKGMQLLTGFLVSCTVLLFLSYAMAIWPQLNWRNFQRTASPMFGVPVKDYIVQSGMFLMCAFALSHVALDAMIQRRWRTACLTALLAALFLGNIFFVATGRTTVISYVLLTGLFALQRFDWKGRCVLILAGVVLSAVVWVSSPYLRARVLGLGDEIRHYDLDKSPTSAGYRIEFYRKSIALVAAAPLIGHGTGTIYRLFREISEGQKGTYAEPTGNPHNVTLEIAIQTGILGVVVLYAMWLAHLLLFRGGGFLGWIGSALVVQDVACSLFLSHLLDFNTGWIYAVGVGVLGGMVLRRHGEEPRLAT